MAAPLRVALVTETWPPEVNGVALTLARLAAGLRERGHDVEVLRPRQPGDAPRPPRGEVLRPALPLPLYAGVRLGWPSRGFVLRRWHRRRPDVVHVATEGPLGWSALAAARRLRIPVTSTFHTNFHAYARHYGLGRLARWVDRRLIGFHRRCVATLAPSPGVVERLRDAGVPGAGLLARGVDATRFSPARFSAATRAGWGLAPGDLALVCVGRLAPEKNLDLAVRALGAVRARHGGARLVLVGDGPARRRYEALDGVTLLGELPQAEVGAVVASSDVFLLPSLTETFGNVLLEALACGVATAAFDYAAAALHVVDGENGLKAPPGDEAAFLAAATRLADDAGLRTRLGAAARTTAERVGWGPVVDTLEQALRTAVYPEGLAWPMYQVPCARATSSPAPFTQSPSR